MKATSFILVTAISAILILGCSKKEPAPQPESDKPADTKQAPAAKGQIGQKAGTLEGLTYVKGDPVTFAEDKVYVVEFWATWCPPCRESIPHLTEIQKQFKDKGVTVIGVSNEAVETVKSFVTEKGDAMNYTVAVDTEGTVGDGYMGAFGQRGIPTAFIVDGKGNVIWFGHPMKDMDAVLAKLVDAEAAGTGN